MTKNHLSRTSQFWSHLNLNWTIVQRSLPANVPCLVCVARWGHSGFRELYMDNGSARVNGGRSARSRERQQREPRERDAREPRERDARERRERDAREQRERDAARRPRQPERTDRDRRRDTGDRNRDREGDRYRHRRSSPRRSRSRSRSRSSSSSSGSSYSRSSAGRWGMESGQGRREPLATPTMTFWLVPSLLSFQFYVTTT